MMKKLNYFFTVVAGAMMLASCSHDKEVVEPNYDNAVQQIVLQVASNGDGLTTRGGRELLSDEAGQKIDKVTVVVLKVPGTGNSTVHYTTTIENWSNASYGYANGTQATIKLPKEKKLSVNEKIRVYAYGYSNESYYSIPTFPESGSFSEVLKLDYASSSNKIPEEIFAGSTKEDYTVESSDFNVSVVLNRQVAGAYFYVHNIPYFKSLDKDSKLRLVASDENDQLILGAFANEDINAYEESEDAGVIKNNRKDGDVNYVVNGAKSTTDQNNDSYVLICEESLGKWYSAFTSTDKGLLDKANWIPTKDATSGDNPVGRKGSHYVKGSVFASSFVIPFEKINKKQTLKLELVDKDGNVLRAWNVNLPSRLVPSKAITTWSKSNDEVWAFNTKESADENSNIYSILRNHLYCVGSKLSNGKTPGEDPDPSKDPDPDPDDPDDPDPDNPDEPEDLSKGQILELKVNHNWEVIYKMELE